MGRPKSDKELRIIQLFNVYKKAQLAIKHKYYQPSIFNKKDKVSEQQVVDTINYVDGLLDLLSKRSRMIIENEFLNADNYGWWYAIYSTATYYRIKQSAIDEFINLINIPESIK